MFWKRLFFMLALGRVAAPEESPPEVEANELSSPVTIVLSSPRPSRRPVTILPSGSPPPTSGQLQLVTTDQPSTVGPSSLPSTTSVSVQTSTQVSTQASPTSQPSTPSGDTRRTPCSCKDGACLCCSGYLLNRLNVTTRNRACLKVEYEPDEFEFNIKLLFNNRQLYQRKISGKNPQPICLPIRRIISINACMQFSNVYLIGRNIHACIDFHGDWNEIELFSVSFECFRIGVNGVAHVKPEEGGGIPVPTHAPSNLGPQDYDDSARSLSSSPSYPGQDLLLL